MSRIDDIEDILGVKILSKVNKGESLEKYEAVVRDRKALLRIYDDNYYTNRFLREGIILRQLTGGRIIQFPRIIDEWPEYQIRAIEWYDLSDKRLNYEESSNVLEWINRQEANLPYSLEEDLIQHLNRVDDIHVAYQDNYTRALELLDDHIEWQAGSQQLVHGDFHLDNISRTEEGDKIIVYDWEYTTYGSEYYDKAYLKVMNGFDINVPIEWELLVTTVICHWYLQDDNFSPKEAIEWVNRLGELKKKF